MKKQDYYWMAGYIAFFSLVIWFAAEGLFSLCNKTHPYLSGFVQFTVFATSGELLSTRILYGSWAVNKALGFKALVWGTGGLCVTVMFNVLSEGVIQAQASGMLPFDGSNFARAFLTSCLLNLFFAPIHAAAMRIFGNYGEERFLRGRRMTAYEATMSVEWGEFVDFTFFKTAPFFWIPVNTLGFLLPGELQVAFAALLSFVFGMLMTLLKLRERKRMEA